MYQYVDFVGILNSVIEFLLDLICCRLKLGKYKSKDDLNTSIATNSLTSAAAGSKSVQPASFIPAGGTPAPTLTTTTPSADHSINPSISVPLS